jgi:hypothetical protein
MGMPLASKRRLQKTGPGSVLKGGKYKDTGKSGAVHESKRHKNTATTKTECPFRVRAAQDADGKFTTVVVDPDHNHDAVVACKRRPLISVCFIQC